MAGNNDSVKFTVDLNARQSNSFKDVTSKLKQIKGDIKLIGPSSKDGFGVMSAEARKAATNINAIRSNSIDVLNSKLDKTKSKLKDINTEAKKGINIKGGKEGGIGNVLGGKLEGKASELAGGIPGGLGSIATSLGPIGIGVGAVVGGLALWGSHVSDIAKEVKDIQKNFSRVGKEDIKDVTAKADALNKVLGVTAEQSSDAAKSLEKTFGLNTNSALDLLKKGEVATGGKLNIEALKEFGPQLKDLNYDAEDSIKLFTKLNNEGIDPSKYLDGMKKFKESARSLNEDQEKLLKSIGLKNVKKDLKSGVLTERMLYDQIFSKINNYSKETQAALISNFQKDDLTANQISKIVDKTTNSWEKLTEAQGKYGKENEKLLEQQERLSKAQQDQAKAFEPITKALKNIGNELAIITENFLASAARFVTTLDPRKKKSDMSQDELNQREIEDAYYAGASVEERDAIRRRQVQQATDRKTRTFVDKMFNEKKSNDINRLFSKDDAEKKAKDAAAATLDNAVQGASSNVRNIYFNDTKFMEIGTQVIGNQQDVDDIMYKLQTAFQTILNDASQSSLN